MSTFKFDLGADAARDMAEDLADGSQGSGFLNLKKIPENQPMYFRILPFSQETIDTVGSAILAVKKWVFQSYLKNDKGQPKYVSTSSPKSLGKAHAKDADFGDFLIKRMESELEREHYERDADGEYTGDLLLDANDNPQKSLYVETTENPVVQLFRASFKYASKAGKPHPVREGEKIADNSVLRFPERTSSIEYWVAAVQVESEMWIDEDKDRRSEPIGDPVILVMPQSVFTQIVGGWHNGAEIPGLVKMAEVGHLITEQNGIDIMITRFPRAGEGSNFTVSPRLSPTGSQSYIPDEFYLDENRIDGLARLKEGISTEDCIEVFKILIGDKPVPETSGAETAATLKNMEKKEGGKAGGKSASKTGAKGGAVANPSTASAEKVVAGGGGAKTGAKGGSKPATDTIDV
jgi:hypothetical protein